MVMNLCQTMLLVAVYIQPNYRCAVSCWISKSRRTTKRRNAVLWKLYI